MKINPSPEVYDRAKRQYTQTSEQAPAEPATAAGLRRFTPSYLLISVSLVPLAEALNICDASPGPESELIVGRTNRLVRDILPSLSAGEIELVVSCFADGESYSRIARRHGVSKQAIRGRMRRVLAKLRAALNELGIRRIEDIR